jgi:ribonuclease HII
MTLYEFEQRLWGNGHMVVAGCDEVGRGPLAGPVVAAAVVLHPSITIEGLNDSKQLSEKKRNQLYEEIQKHAMATKVTFIYPEEIDRINIYQASKKAMIESIHALEITPTYVLSDAMPLTELGIPFEAIIKGDAKSATIAAASIVAKVERDQYMEKMDEMYPGYGFKKHKGYPTKDHLKQLQERGVCAIHRRTYKPVRDILEQQLSLDLKEV